MRRRTFFSGLLGVILGSPVDLSACGDKFLRVGRSGRFRRYAAVHPAAILIYSPRNSTRKGIEELKALLKRAGHTPVSVDHHANVSAALAAELYDVVMADYQDAERIEASLHSATSRAALLPILDRPDKAVETAAKHRYGFLITPQVMTKYDALAEIDRLMASRSGSNPASR